MRRIFLAAVIIFAGMVSYAADLKSFKLDNGQNVIIEEVHDNPIVIIDTWIKTGSINETDENNGAAHFLEHLFFKGTEKHPAKEFDQILEAKGAVTNAATSKDFTHYYILIPSEHFETALELHSDMLLNPLIPRKELEKERKVVIEEIAKNNDKPVTELYRNLTRSFYKIHPYKRDVIGTKDVIENISREQILDFYKKWYYPANMTTVIIGDIDSKKALELVKENFSAKQAPDKKITPPVYKMDKKPASKIEVKEDAKIASGYILIGFKGVPAMTDKDSYALDILSAILGEGKSSRLYKHLKEQKQLVQSISASHSSMKEDSIFYISANYLTEDIERLKSEIFDEVKRLYKNEIPEEEVQKAKKIIERDTYYSRESVSNIAAEIGYTVTLTGTADYYKNYIENINKVTAKDLKRAAKAYLNPDNAVISILLPSREGKPEIKKEAPKNYSAKLLSSDKNTSKYELENGAVLVITQNDANDITALEMSSRGGNSLEKIPGTASVTASAMLKGTKKYKKQELSLLMEENGIIISPSTSGDSFSLSAKFTKNEKDTALELLEEIAKNAALDAYEIERVKTDKLNSIKNISNTPSSLAFDEFKAAAWEGTPYGNAGKVLKNTIPSIQREDVLEYYKNLFPAENTVITINGNINDQEYINYFSRILKNSGKAKLDLSSFKLRFKELKENTIVKIPKESNAAWIIAGWHTDGILNEKDWAALEVINSILGSGMSSRIFTRLRDEQGLAYQAGSSFAANVNKGIFAVYIGTNPNNVKTAEESLFREVNLLKTEFVTDKELSEAKDKILGNFILSLETNMDKASVINSLEIDGRGYKFIDKYKELINSVTLKDIIRTANKYFSKPYVYVITGPKNALE